MKKAVGLCLIVLGVAYGLYFGLWWAFIGGIIDVINEIRAPELSAAGVAIGIAKVVFAGFIGWASALAMVLFGIAIGGGE